MNKFNVCDECGVRVVKMEVSYVEVEEDRVKCCVDCWKDYYEGDEELKSVVRVDW